MTETSDARPEHEPALDFYISYTGQGSDRLWAEWIGAQLKRARYTVELDVWSWLPGENSAAIFGRLLGGSGRLGEALSFAQGRLVRARQMLGEDHPSTLTIQSTYGQVVLAMGRRKDALAINQDIYERACRTLGEDHPDTRDNAAVLAGNLDALGRAEASQLRREDPKGTRG